MAKNTYELDNRGDAIEQKWGHRICQNFSNYEKFWQKYIVPLTNRPKDIYLRSSTPSDLAELTAYHHKVFRHLAICHQILSHEEKILYTSRGFHEFYDRLQSAIEGVKRTLSTTKKLLEEKYKTRAIPKEKWWRIRFSKNGDMELSSAWEEVVDRVGKYRNQLDHLVEFTRIDDRVPKREKIKKYANWTVVSRLRESGRWEEVLIHDFVDPVSIAREDLDFAELCFNRIWAVLLQEFSQAESTEAFKRDFGAQSRESYAPPPPELCFSTASTSSTPTSGDSSSEVRIFPRMRDKKAPNDKK